VAENNLHFGIREHAMAVTVNGLSLSKLRTYGATFFIFSDYARPAIGYGVVGTPCHIIFTHDAMADGEDGPSHQPCSASGVIAGDSRADYASVRRCYGRLQSALVLEMTNEHKLWFGLFYTMLFTVGHNPSGLR
jgi:transketolase C-terminal domain/subunit